MVFLEFVLWMNDTMNIATNPCEYSRSVVLVVYTIQFDIHEATFYHKSCDTNNRLFCVVFTTNMLQSNLNYNICNPMLHNTHGKCFEFERKR